MKALLPLLCSFAPALIAAPGSAPEIIIAPPEPETWWLFGAGLGVLVWGTRWRAKSSTPVVGRNPVVEMATDELGTPGVVVPVRRTTSKNPPRHHATEALAALSFSDPDWVAVAEHWLDLSLAAKGTAWEATVECLGEALSMRDADALGRGLRALQSSVS